jgi:hypothetical protein
MNTLTVNPDWTKLPLFDRKGWKRMPFGALADSINERVEPRDAAEEICAGLEHLDRQKLHFLCWGKGSDVIGDIRQDYEIRAVQDCRIYTRE